MKRRDLLKSALLAIPGVGWLARRAGAGKYHELPGWSRERCPKPLEFANFYARPSYYEPGEVVVVGAGQHYPTEIKTRIVPWRTLKVRYPAGVPIPPITKAGGDFFRFKVVWHKGEWWVLRTWLTGMFEALELLKRYPEENKPFIDAFTNPNYVIIDPFSKTK